MTSANAEKWDDYIPLRAYQAATDDGDETPIAPPPTWLSEGGKEAWERLAPHVRPSPTEVDEFACYCESIGEYQEGTKLIAEIGMITADIEGTIMANPAASIRDRADAKISRWASRFRR